MRSTIPAVAPRIDFLDGVRAVAALFVVAHHCWLQVYPGYPANTGPAWSGWMLYGHVAVSVFIVVSGFSLSLGPARRGWSLSAGGATEFLRRRAWRILPTYWAALALSCVVYGLVTRSVTGAAVSPKAIVVHALLLQNLVDSPKPNGAFWSIAVEWQIYFLFPALLLLRRRCGVVLQLLTVLAVVVVGYYFADLLPLGRKFLDLTPQYIVLFVLGSAAAQLLSHAAARWAAAAAAVLGTAFIGLCLALGPVPVTGAYFWVDMLVGCATACLLAAMHAGRATLARRVLSVPLLLWTGQFSYSIYLVHAPVIWLLWDFAVSTWSVSGPALLLAYLATALPVVIASSWVFFLVCERPFLTHRSWDDWARALRRQRVGQQPAGPAGSGRPTAPGTRGPASPADASAPATGRADG